MPSCYVTISEDVHDLTASEINIIRDVVADGLNSKSRILDRNHIVIRVNRSSREFMLGEIEVEIFSQLYIRRLFSRDKRAKNISKILSEKLKYDFATWINMGMVGYCRVTKGGEIFYSD